MRGSPPPRDPPGREWLGLGALAVVLSLRAYWPTLSSGWTDTDILADYACAARGWRSLLEPLTCGVAGDNANFWRPAAMLQFWLLRATLGDWVLGWHLWSLALHVVNATLLGGLVRRHAGLPQGALATLLFAGHPLGVEIVPALARNLELSFCLGVLGALYTVGRPGSWAFALLALTSKEAGVLLLPVLAVYAPRQTRWAPLLLGFVAYALSRHAVLEGLGGYGTAPDIASLAVAPVELMLPSLGAVAPPLRGPGAGWAAMALAGLAVTTWVASRTAARSLSLAMALVLGGSLALYAVTGTYSRRLLYLPSAAACVLVALAFGRAFAIRNRPGLLLGGAWFAAWVHGSPIYRPYTDWQLATAAVEPFLRAEAWREIPDGATVWVVDRPARVDAEPRRFRYWSTRKTLNNTAALYSIEAWVHEHTGKRVELEHISSMAMAAHAVVATMTVDPLVVVRPGAQRSLSTRSPFTLAEDDGALRIEGRGTVMVWNPGGVQTRVLGDEGGQ
ncbi:MAG: hypothetical protein FJ090_05670 [Deltaproteobacteria bacterium]|nr:hypothetical protein [Deltaproteobacteria bacterium]